MQGDRANWDSRQELRVVPKRQARREPCRSWLIEVVSGLSVRAVRVVSVAGFWWYETLERFWPRSKP